MGYSPHQIDKLFLDCLLMKNLAFFNVYKKLTKHYFIKCENQKSRVSRPHTKFYGDTATLLCFWMVCILLHMTRAGTERLGQTAFGLRSQVERSHRLAFTAKVYRPMVRPSLSRKNLRVFQRKVCKI